VPYRQQGPASVKVREKVVPRFLDREFKEEASDATYSN